MTFIKRTVSLNRP